jgi:hypothetical protein
MRNAIGAIADRLIAMVVPRTTAGACQCPDGGTRYYCTNSILWKCQINCYCQPVNCEFAGRC